MSNKEYLRSPLCHSLHAHWSIDILNIRICRPSSTIGNEKFFALRRQRKFSRKFFSSTEKKFSPAKKISAQRHLFLLRPMSDEENFIFIHSRLRLSFSLVHCRNVMASESILEQQRRLHEERERLMDTMTKEMLRKKATVSSRPLSVTLIFFVLSASRTNQFGTHGQTAP